MARRSKGSKAKAPKRPSYIFIPRSTPAGESMYAMLDQLVEEHHDHLTNARIALAWSLAWKPDVDGRVTLGMCKKASELDRELAPWDFVIILSQEFWSSALIKDHQRLALLDHELCHAEVKHDEDGDHARDAKDRVIYRIRKHDVEEFSSIARRHGCWKRDLEDFFAAMNRGQKTPLFDRDDKRAPGTEPTAPARPH